MAIIQTTIAGLRTFVGTPCTSDVYYTDTPGQEGNWKYDAGDTSSTDNTGTILVSGSYRFKRVYQEYVNVKWFGAKGDGICNDTDDIQKALDFISKTYAPPFTGITPDWNHWLYGGGTLFFPAGQYIIKETLYIGQHTRLLGVSKGGDFFPYQPGDTGTVIKCEFEDLDSWAFEADCRWTQDIPPLNPPNPAPPDQIWKGGRIDYSSYVTGADFDNGLVTTNLGIVIEGLCINCEHVIEHKEGEDEWKEYRPIFGAIRLNGSPNSIIKNCGVLNPNVAILLGACWNATIQNVYSVSKYYGVVLCDCNSIKIAGSYIVGRGDASIPIEQDLPDFVYPDYIGLDNQVKRDSTGIYLRGVSSVAIDACAIEKFNVGLFATWATFSTTSLYIEGLFNGGSAYAYGVLMNGPVQASMTQTKLIKLLQGFYIGIGPQVIADNVSLDNVTSLYIPNDPAYRKIQFSQVKVVTVVGPLALATGKREFKNDIIFIDEIGDTVYVDPSSINNKYNLGFSENDPVYNLDDALIRWEYSQRKVKRILIKAGTVAKKDVNERYIDALDLLLSTYGQSASPTTLEFDGNGTLGQISVRGGVKFSIRGITLKCSTTAATTPSFNASIFRLNYGHFELYLENVKLNLGNGYSLVAADYPAANAKSYITTRWLNTEVDGTGAASISPYQGGSKLLAVDCIQYNSQVLPASPIYALPNRGWYDVQIINNNLP